MLGVRIGEDLEGWLVSISQRTGRSKSSIVRKALEKHLEDMEDIAAALESLEEGGPNITLEEMKAQLGLDNKTKQKSAKRISQARTYSTKARDRLSGKSRGRSGKSKISGRAPNR